MGIEEEVEEKKNNLCAPRFSGLVQMVLLCNGLPASPPPPSLSLFPPPPSPPLTLPPLNPSSPSMSQYNIACENVKDPANILLVVLINLLFVFHRLQLPPPSPHYGLVCTAVLYY